MCVELQCHGGDTGRGPGGGSVIIHLHLQTALGGGRVPAIIYGLLLIASCSKQDSAGNTRLSPLCGTDVREYVYYLQCEGVRSDSLQAVWNVTSWGNVTERCLVLVGWLFFRGNHHTIIILKITHSYVTLPLGVAGD